MRANARQYAESLTIAQETGKRNAEELVNGLMRILAKKKQRHMAKKVLLYLQKQEIEKQGIVEVTIETANKIDKGTEKSLIAKAEEMYPGKKVKATFTLNSDLGAGFRIRGNNTELDQSFTTNLKKLRNQLTSL